MSLLKQTERRGQATVEFALIIGVLLLIIFVVIESGYLLHANLTVQSAAREAGRYAITGQFDTDCLIESPPCDDPRVASVKALAEEKLASLPLDSSAVFEESGYYLIEVFGTDASGNWVADSAGIPGRPILVRVSYRAPIWTPLLRPIAETVMVTGQTIMNNEKVVSAGSAGDTIAPPIPPPPSIEPTPQPAVDLVMSKTGPAIAMEDTPFQYTLTVHNSGGRDADSLIVSDTLDPDLNYILDSDPDCSPSGSVITCNWSSLPIGGSRSVDISVSADEGSAGRDIPNTATITYTGSGSELEIANNEDSVSTHIIPFTAETDLAITKSGPLAAPISTASQTFYVDYNINVINNGPNNATNVVVTDPLGGGLTFSAAGSSTECSFTSTVTCSLGDLSAGASRTLTIRTQTPFTDGQHTNTATVRGDDPDDLDESNNDSSHTVEFVYLADLEISKTASASVINAGETLTYNIAVRNRPESPHTATGVHISDPLPDNVQLQSATYSAPEGWGNCAVSGNVVTCPVGTLQPNQSASAVIRVVPTRAGSLVNSAQVAGEQNDPDTINSATAVTTVNAESDVSIHKTTSPTTGVRTGEPLAYNITIRNDGPSRATGVYMVDPLPAELVFQSVETTYGHCDWDSGLRTVTCWLGVMPAVEPNNVATITIWTIPMPLNPGETESFTNTADVYADDDPDEFNNSSVTTSTVLGSAFIVLSSSSGHCGNPGSTVTVDGYSWETRNHPDTGDVTITWEYEGGELINSETIPQVGGLGAGGSFSFEFLIPDDEYAGRIRVHAAQPHSPTALIDTEYFTVPCPNADLEVTEVTASVNQAEQYEPVEVTAMIANTGNRDATSDFFVSLYAVHEPNESEIPVIELFDVGIVRGLQDGEEIELILSAHEGFSDTGDYRLVVLADSDPSPEGVIVELYENNNNAGVNLTVAETLEEPPIDPPRGTQQLSGETYIATALSDDWELQPRVRVSVYTEPGGVLLGTTYSELADARYQFNNLPDASSYYVAASITIEGAVYSYPGSGTGIVAPPSQSLILYPEGGP